MLKTYIILVAAGCAVCGLAFGAASWSGQPYALIVGNHITGPAQAPTGLLAMTLDHDGPCTIGVSVDHAGNEVLNCSGETLVTGYKLTGAALQNGDADWVSSSAFLTRNYDVQGNGPSDPITLWVRAAGASSRANNAGTYSASVILTVSW
jgi:hypothetical protein